MKLKPSARRAKIAARVAPEIARPPVSSYLGLNQMLVQFVHPDDVRVMAEGAGWEVSKPSETGHARYVLPDDEGSALVVPLDPMAHDYAARMTEAIDKIGTEEGVHPAEVLDSLLSSTGARFRRMRADHVEASFAARPDWVREAIARGSIRTHATA